jgi:hypothetical protein
MNLGQKLIFAFVGLAGLIVVSGYLAIAVSRKALQERIGSATTTIAEEMVGEMDSDLYGRLEAFQAYACTQRLREALVRSNAEFAAMPNVREYIDRIDAQWTATPSNASPPLLDSLLANSLSHEFRTILDFYQQRYGFRVIGEMFVTNRYGANVAQSERTSDYRQDDEDWWQQCAKEGPRSPM